MEPNHKFWNEQHQALRQALAKPENHDQAIALFLSLHAMVHPAETSQTGLVSFEDEVWQGLSEAGARCIPPGEEHSIVWCIWHLARIEDVTMNLLAAGTDQLFKKEGWQERLCIPNIDTGNGMDVEAVATLSAAIDLPALRTYRLAVGRRTREVALQLQPKEIKQKVQPARLERVLAEGAVIPTQQGLIDYWGGLTIAGLLLMPPTRHTLVHLNESAKIKGKLKRNPCG